MDLTILAYNKCIDKGEHVIIFFSFGLSIWYSEL